MPSKKNKKDISGYAFANNYKNLNIEKKVTLSERNKRKEEYTKQKKEKERNEKTLIEHKKFIENKEINQRENKKLIDWLKTFAIELNENQIYWISSTLAKLNFEPGTVLYVNHDLSKLSYVFKYKSNSIKVSDKKLYVWKKDNIPDDSVSIELPETVREFISKNCKSGQPIFPEQKSLRYDDYVNLRKKIISEWLIS